jgi:hypothetical protein
MKHGLYGHPGARFDFSLTPVVVWLVLTGDTVLALMACIRLFARLHHDSCRDGIPAAAVPVWLPASEPPRFSSKSIYCFSPSQRLLCWCFLSGVLGFLRGRIGVSFVWCHCPQKQGAHHPMHQPHQRTWIWTYSGVHGDLRGPQLAKAGSVLCVCPRVAGAR